MWSSYLHKVCNKAKAAPVKLFKDPFPYGKNGFKVGMKLEGIDPEHQAIISVLTVAQVKGKPGHYTYICLAKTDLFT